MSKNKGAGESADDNRDMPFEEAVRKLESIVDAMEGQDLPLETLLARYEEGARLANLCESKLNEAELKIQQLEKNAKGEPVIKSAAIEGNSRVTDTPSAG